MSYTHSHILTKNVGNNSLCFAQRKKVLGKAQIIIPSLKHITHIQDIQLGNDMRIQEFDETGTLHSCTGLEHIYHLKQEQTQIILMDNHNHALYFRLKHLASLQDRSTITLTHIDQHSDLNDPPTSLQDYLNKKSDSLPCQGVGVCDRKTQKLSHFRAYTNYVCQISSFIKPFLDTSPQTNFTRIKSEHQLLNLTPPPIQERRHGTSLILDIDLDFRAPQMSIEKLDETISITRQYIAHANIVTIATSPMFIEQTYALEILDKLLSSQHP